MASPVETQQAFLEGHALAFGWFGGVVEEVRYDNLGSAVKKVLRGRRRVETDRFIALRSHYLFDSIFTTPGIEGAHEKGGVEGEVGRFRRNHLVPVPSFGSIAGLNAFIVEACEGDLARRIDGRPATVAEQLAVERPLLRVVDSAFDAAELSSVRVDAKEQLSRVVDLAMKDDQAATFSSWVVVSLSVTRMPSLNFTPSSTSATSSWPLQRRQRSCAASSSL